jgi:hypothetical protein
VLPGRTHPEMQGTLGGGYLLHATKVIDEPGLQRGGGKRGRTSGGASGGGSAQDGRAAKKGRTS